MAYTDKTTIEGYLGKTITIEATLLASWIASVKDWIDRYCATTFESSAATTRYFEGNDRDEIEIDPFTTITSLKILDVNGSTLHTLTEASNGDFLTYPYNTTEKYRLILTAVAKTGCFPAGYRSVEVMAFFCSSTTVPDAIKLVATQLMARLIESKGSAQGKEIKQESLGDYSVSYTTEALEESAEAMSLYSILDQYKKYEF